MSDSRTPAEIEADIVRKRRDLAATLDEIGVRVHPRTIVDQAQYSLREAVNRGSAQAYTTVNRAVSNAREQLVHPDGSPRMERVVPVAVAAVALVVVLAGFSSRRKRR